MNRPSAPREALNVRDVLRWWPIVVLVVTAAVVAATLAASWRVPEYSASTRLVVVPLVQWDDTFLGTSLARDGGDADRTGPTVAALIDTPGVAEATARTLGREWTPDKVAAAVEIKPVDRTNLIDVVARGADPALASRLAETFAATAIADRWTTISAELDAQIALLTPTASLERDAGGAARQLALLRLVRQSGVDPTLRVHSANPAERVEVLPAPALAGMAAAGGLLIGLLAALGLAAVQHRSRVVAAGPARRENGRPTDDGRAPRGAADERIVPPATFETRS